MPKYFVTGLCLQGNKGGPALALSLVSEIRRHIPDAEFVFEVPSAPEEWPHEVNWSHKYKFEIIKRIRLKNILPPYCFIRGRLSECKVWWKTLKSSDVLIQMSAICYVGPPAGAGSFSALINSPRVLHLFLAWAAFKPMLAWTQSYGPLSTKLIRAFAKLDLRRQPVIFCRGDDCKSSIEELLPKARVLSFPDVAIKLPFDKKWGKIYVENNFSCEKKIVTVSPSAVLYSRCKFSDSKNRHIGQIRKICDSLYKAGYHVLLIPHTFRPSNESPVVCDYAVCKIIYEAEESPNLSILEDDLSPSQLKSIISGAHFHVGARYHSVVAALSSNVPAISLSWHPKYRDLMTMYGMEDYLLDEGEEHRVSALIRKIDFEYGVLRKKICKRKEGNMLLVDDNVKLFVKLLKNI